MGFFLVIVTQACAKDQLTLRLVTLENDNPWQNISDLAILISQESSTLFTQRVKIKETAASVAVIDKPKGKFSIEISGYDSNGILQARGAKAVLSVENGQSCCLEVCFCSLDLLAQCNCAQNECLDNCS